MDSSLFKDFTTSRGYKYHYYFVRAADASKPTLAFLHGFPSSAQDWRKIVPAFKEKGYGLVVPDMLGYGGTDKPVETESYILSHLAKDIVDILDAEKVENVIAIGHDWSVPFLYSPHTGISTLIRLSLRGRGSGVVSRLAPLFQDRFIGFAFLALGYFLPAPDFDIDQSLAYTKEQFGYELYGYWKCVLAPMNGGFSGC